MSFRLSITRRSMYAAVAVCSFALVLSGCGTPATPQALPPTATIPTRVPTQAPIDGDAEPAQAQPTAVAVQPTSTPVPPTVAPTLEATATATRRVFATATPNVTPIPGDAAVGEALFANGLGGDSIVPACSTCHSIVDDGTVKLGPLMGGLMGHAAHHAAEAGQDIYTYLHTSIVDPNAYLVPNEAGKVYAAGGVSIMYQNYAQDLTEDQITDIIAYLVTLK